MDNVALEPCPFCGSEAKVSTYLCESLWSHNVVEWLNIACHDCDILMASEKHDELRARWNTRALITATEAMVEAGEDALIESKWPAADAIRVWTAMFSAAPKVTS
jgi:hypothetical protein